MERASIDGRLWKRSAAPFNTPSRNSEAYTKLRPASPPRINPWSRQTPTTLVSDDFPALPGAPSSTEKSQDPATRSSRASSSSSCPQSGDASQPALTARSESTCSDTSRHILEAAAPRAIENLWTRPFGADVVAHTNTMTFRVHRDIVAPESAWFRDNLPPPNADGSPVRVYLDCAAEAAAHCLRFIYTGKVEICEFNESRPWNAIHLPRCVLGYCAAVYLRVSRMATRILEIVEKTSIELGNLVTTSYLNRYLDSAEWMEFSWNYQNALNLLYHQGPLTLMMPLRLAMAGVLDATLFWLVRQPPFMNIIRTAWRHILHTLLADQAEYRRLLREANPTVASPVPDEITIKKLFLSKEINAAIRKEEASLNSENTGFGEAATESRRRGAKFLNRPRRGSF